MAQEEDKKIEHLSNSLIQKKPWGDFLQFTKNEESTVKILEIYPGEAISLQWHTKREEFWYILRGKPTIIIDEKKIKANPQDHFYIKKSEKHRILNDTNKVVLVLEISFGHFDEKDEECIEDRYNRCDKP